MVAEKDTVDEAPFSVIHTLSRSCPNGPLVLRVLPETNQRTRLCAPEWHQRKDLSVGCVRVAWSLIGR